MNESQLEVRQDDPLGVIKEVDETKKAKSSSKSPKGTKSGRDIEKQMADIEKETAKKELTNDQLLNLFRPTAEDPIV